MTLPVRAISNLKLIVAPSAAAGVIQRSAAMEAFGPPQYPVVLRGFNEPRPALCGIAMDGEWEYPQVHEDEPRG